MTLAEFAAWFGVVCFFIWIIAEILNLIFDFQSWAERRRGAQYETYIQTLHADELHAYGATNETREDLRAFLK
jgi:hypothetical protein